MVDVALHPEQLELARDLLARPGRRVRLHSLPGDKRYPGHRGEWRELLTRHNQILTHALGEARPYWQVLTEYGPSDISPSIQPLLDRREYVALEEEWEDGELRARRWITAAIWRAGQEDALLRAVANEEASGVWLLNPRSRALAHPYDGGVDLYSPDAAIALGWSRRFAAWRPGACPAADPAEVLAYCAPEERAVIRALVKRRATVELDDDDRVTHLRVPPGQVDDALLAGISELGALRHLWLQETRRPCRVDALHPPAPDISDRGLARLAGLTRLETLRAGPLPGVSAGCLEALRRALPACDIELEIE